jgi:predicted DNA-binding transcriptional regulator
LNKDQFLGLGILVGSILGIIIYGWLVFLVAPIIVLQITAFIAILALLGILAWIGYTLATTLPPKRIEELEEEVKSN